MNASGYGSKNVVIWGGRGHAKVLRDCLAGSGVAVTAVFDNDPRVPSPFPDVPIYHEKRGFQEWLESQRGQPLPSFLVAIGGEKGRDRIEVQEYLESAGLIAAVACHPSAHVASGCSIGAGSQILMGACLSVEVHLGKSCIVNTAASIDHECRLDDGIHIAPGAVIAGCVTVEKYAMVGLGAHVLPRVRIGEGAIVGAGAVVIRDVEPYTVVAGSPARVLRTIKRT